MIIEFVRVFKSEDGLLLLLDLLDVPVDDGDCEEDTGARADGAQEVGDDGEGANAHAPEGGGDGDVPLEDGLGPGVRVALGEQPLRLEVLGHVVRALSREVDPVPAEEGTS